SKPMTQFAAHSSQVVDAAKDFYTKLKEVLPPDEGADWSPFPVLQLELSTAAVESLTKATAEDRARLFADELAAACKVIDDDKVGEQIFGIATCKGKSLKEVSDAWAEGHKGASIAWLESIHQQLIDGAFLKIPSIDWQLLPDRTGSLGYAPVLAWVHPKGSIR